MKIVANGVAHPIASPRDAIAAGIGYLPEDGKEMGLFLEMNVAENIAAARLSKFGSWWLDGSSLLDTAQRFVERLRIAAGSVSRQVGKLSGGNQQKVMFAKWLLCEPAVLIVDEPTRGIDVGAREEIYTMLRELPPAAEP